MKANKLKIHVESGNIYHDNNDTNESIYGFFENQEDETKRWIGFELVLSDDLVNIKDGNDEKYDMLKVLILETQSSYFITLMIT